MISASSLLFFAVAIIALCAYLLFRQRKAGETIYLDTGLRSKVFRSEHHKIAAKPDRIEADDSGFSIPHEFKSRTTRVTNRDIVQVKTASIALRDSGYNVREAIIELGNGKRKQIEVEPTDVLMSGHVGDLIRVARSIKRGEQPEATPAPHKCRFCPYREQCEYSLSQ